MAPVRPSALLVLLPLLAAACGPGHIVREGVFAFEATEVFFDDCQLLPSAQDLWDGDVLITGEVVRMDYGLLDTRLVGSFLAGDDERFNVDGSATNVTTQVAGRECLLDVVSIHIDGETRCSTQFDGVVRVVFGEDVPEACRCTLRARFRAVQDGLVCEE